MKIKYLVTSLLAMLTSFCSVHAQYTQQTQQTIHHQDAATLSDIWLEGQQQHENIPFIAGVVVKNQQILWSGAFGESNLATSQPASVTTMSSVCSISKVFTATATMKLVDEGKLSLDNKVKDILPDLALTQAFPAGGEITIQSLLTHTSGVPRDTEHGYWSAPAHHFPDTAELYGSLSGAKTLHAVGSAHAYSNVGYALLGQIIQQVSGTSYKKYIESEIFTALNMTHSTVELPTHLIGKEHATGYTAPNRKGQRKPANLYQTQAMQSAAGISTSVLDLAKFAMWQFRQADSENTEIMSRTALLSMYKPHAKQPHGNSRGYGYEVSEDAQGNTWVAHGGMCPGYVSFLKMDVTNKMAYAILVNANKVRSAAYVNGLIEIFKRSKQIQPKSESNSLQDYVGFYDPTPWNSEYYVAKWGEDLMLLYFPAQSLHYALYQYRHDYDDVFRLVKNGKPGDETIEFLRDESGKVVKIKEGENTHKKRASPEMW